MIDYTVGRTFPDGTAEAVPINDATIFVRFVVPGFHSWPDAPVHRGYLGHSHRHLFHVELRCSVEHDGREIEFHDLLDVARAAFPGGDLGGQSCETMARELAKKMARRYGRAFEVAVSEDGEVGALVSVGAPG